MTWQHLLRTLMIAVIGAIALALISQANAESGDGSSVISPQQAEAFLKGAAPESAEPAVTGRGAADTQDGIEQTAAIAVSPAVSKLGSGLAEAGRARGLKALVARLAAENGLPYELADAVVRLESGYNPAARNGPHVGLTQINYRTAQSLGYKGGVAGLLDAETNLRYGLKYLAQAHKLADGDTCGTILRYQAGHRTQRMTAAARAYCAKVKTIIAAAE